MSVLYICSLRENAMRMVLKLLVTGVLLSFVVSAIAYSTTKWRSNSHYDKLRVAYALECLALVCQDDIQVCSERTVKACTTSALHLFPLTHTKE